MPELYFHPSFRLFTKYDPLYTSAVFIFTDVIGVCKSCGDIQTLFARTTNRELKKRDVTIVDESDTAVSVHMLITIMYASK